MLLHNGKQNTDFQHWGQNTVLFLEIFGFYLCVLDETEMLGLSQAVSLHTSWTEKWIFYNVSCGVKIPTIQFLKQYFVTVIIAQIKP